MTTKPNVPLYSTGSAASTDGASATRLARLDGEHARITAMLENAIQAFLRQASPSEVNAILLELNGYTLNHFREEEELMGSFAFPGFALHKQEHDRLAAYVRGLLDMRSKQEALRCSVGALDLWLEAHIRIKDNEFSDFLQRKAK
jgi:hemerythrin